MACHQKSGGVGLVTVIKTGGTYPECSLTPFRSLAGGDMLCWPIYERQI